MGKWFCRGEGFLFGTPYIEINEYAIAAFLLHQALPTVFKFY
ncbi:hypothetical protein [Rickettsia canadensis]|nr:hypothetical protein [Rickettsia canadensis]